MWLRTTFQSVFDYSNQLFYWEGPRSRQLNFAVRLNKYLPVEVKYQNRILSDDAKPIIDFQKAGKSTSGLILTKDTLATKKLTSGSSCSPRASAYLEFASKGVHPGQQHFLSHFANSCLGQALGASVSEMK